MGSNLPLALLCRLVLVQDLEQYPFESAKESPVNFMGHLCAPLTPGFWYICLERWWGSVLSVDSGHKFPGSESWLQFLLYV